MFLCWPFAVAVAYAFGVYWCYVVIRRLQDDIAEFRDIKEGVRRFAIIFVWLLTAVIALVLILTGRVLLNNLLSAAREWL